MAVAPSAVADPCLVCHGGPARALFHKRDVPYHRCRACGFTWASPSINPNLENALEDYEDAYLTYLQPSLEDGWNFEILLKWVRRFRRLDGSRILDVGCGSGKLVRYLRAQGRQAEGIEPARALFDRFLADDPAFQCRTLDALAAQADPPRFDLILACDVIEHVARPDRFLDAAAALLAPGGALIVSTPDVGSAVARLFGRRWHFYHRYHLSYLSRRTLAALAAPRGLRESGFARLPRRRSVGYVLQYGLDLLVGPDRVHVPARLKRLGVRLNFFDVMTVCLRPAPAAAVRAPGASA